MQLLNENITQTLNEHYFVESFYLDNKTILELGCGAATMTQKIANTGENRKIIACEIDEIQHQKNLQLDITNITFKLSGAQNIPCEDSSIDMIFMFKSFHHIPKELMNQALGEIKRVLKPNGLAYISEPLFLGEQNYLVSLFHNEEKVRKDAFEAIKACVDNNDMKLFKEVFFNSEVVYNNFKDFEKKQMNLTYNDDAIDAALYTKIQKEYLKLAKEDESAYFLKPFRVDILQKV